MKFNEAMKAMVSGSKVTRKSWLGNIYFILDGFKVKSFQPSKTVFNYDENIMLSDGWLIEGIEGSFHFYDIIDHLKQGNKARLQDWSNESYIIYDSSEKYIIYSTMSEFPHTPDFDSFNAQDWMVLS